LLPALFFPGALLFSAQALANPYFWNNMSVDAKISFMKKLSRKLVSGNIVFVACKSSPIHIGQTLCCIHHPETEGYLSGYMSL